MLAEELGNFVSAVGGKNYAYTLLVPLETLCIVEESTVRDRAVESICKITLSMSEEHVSEVGRLLVVVCRWLCVLLPPSPSP